MNVQAPFILRGRNPDVLTCIANLSSDEVFAPPDLANRMLDMLAKARARDHNGADIWANKDLRLLDPCTKSGVFLREITVRLVKGLTREIPDLRDRVDHVLTRQVFGIGLTQLTGLLSRRTLYCSKHANGAHSIARGFTSEDGNIWFGRTEHEWSGGKCKFCKATKASYDRSEGMETHAYAFVHTSDIKSRIAEIFGGNMQFDVVVGNPPYQLGSNGGTRDKPIYQHFVKQAKQLKPQYLAMVIPSRWMASGLGLASFREEMIKDRRIRELVDFPAASDVFPGVEVKAGVCYFLWDAAHDGNCMMTTIRGKELSGPFSRNLGEHDILVRDARAVSILQKVLKAEEPSVNSILARDKEFGWTSNFNGFHDRKRSGDIDLYFIRKMNRGIGYVDRKTISKSRHLIDTWKVLVPQAYNGGDSVPHQIVGKPQIAPSPSVCTQSFLFFHVQSKEEAKSIQSYYLTRFFRFLVSVRKITQHATHKTYTWVPMQAWDREWNDDELYEKYGISQEEQIYIESQVRAMSLNDGENEQAHY